MLAVEGAKPRNPVGHCVFSYGDGKVHEAGAAVKFGRYCQASMANRCQPTLRGFLAVWQGQGGGSRPRWEYRHAGEPCCTLGKVVVSTPPPQERCAIWPGHIHRDPSIVVRGQVRHSSVEGVSESESRASLTAAGWGWMPTTWCTGWEYGRPSCPRAAKTYPSKYHSHVVSHGGGTTANICASSLSSETGWYGIFRDTCHEHGPVERILGAINLGTSPSRPGSR